MSTVTVTVVSTTKPLYQSLFVQVAIALLLGIVRDGDPCFPTA